MMRGTPSTRFAYLVLLASVGICLAVAACGQGASGGSSPTSPSAPGSSVTGTWRGPAKDSSSPGQMTWQITQSGTSFTGSMTMTDSTNLSARGSVSGMISGSSLQFTINVPAGGFDAPRATCTAEVSGQGEFTSTEITGQYSGTSSCDGAIATGELKLTKQ
jgi:hypothetical protein